MTSTLFKFKPKSRTRVKINPNQTFEDEVIKGYLHNQSVNLDPSLAVITLVNVINSLRDGDGDAENLFLQYWDGTQTDFPIGICQKEVRIEDVDVVHVNIGLIFRHPEMDKEIDYYLLLNEETSLRDFSCVQIEKKSLSKTLEFLQSLPLQEGGNVVIHFYPTGLMPAIIGFLKGFQNFTQKQTGVIMIPYFYNAKSKRYFPGKVWV